MNVRWSFLLLGGVLVLLAGCGAVTPTPVLGPPTSVPRTEVPQTAAPDPFARPEMTVQGALEDGSPFGVTADGNYFKGEPQAPVIVFEFSDFQ